MAGYIGKVKVDSEQVLIGSTMYGISTTAANSSTKEVISTMNSSGNFINSNYSSEVRGLTIHIKFVNGNTATSNLTLKLGTFLPARPIVGNCVCPAGTIISFTLDESDNWVVNDNVNDNTTYTFAEGTTNGAFSVTPSGGSAQTVNIHGLGASAYKSVIDNIDANSTSDGVPTTAAVVSYVSTMTGGLNGLTGSMHFRGIATQEVTDGGTEMPHIVNYDIDSNGNDTPNFSRTAGDVVLYNHAEYVWTGTAWELLGDEGSFAWDNAVIHNSLLTTKGDMIYASESGSSVVPARLSIGTGDNKFLTVSNGLPAWGTVSKTDVGLGNVTNHAQVTAVTWDSTNNKLQQSVSGGTPTDIVTISTIKSALSLTSSDVSLGNVSNNAILNGTNGSIGDIIYWSAANTPARLAASATEGYVLTAKADGTPEWAANKATDANVAQTGITTDGSYAILLKHSTGTSNETDGVNFVSTSGKLVTVNPSTGILSAAGFSGDGSGLSNVTASSVSWANVTDKVTATLNTLGLVKTTSDVVSATGYTAAPIIDGVVYYYDTHYTSSGSANALTSLSLKYVDKDSNTQTSTATDSASTAVAVGAVSDGILYLKSIYYGTTAVSTGVSVDNS